jgi:hypothetical protein
MSVFSQVAITLILSLLIMIIFSILVVGLSAIDIVDLIILLPSLALFIIIEVREHKK